MLLERLNREIKRRVGMILAEQDDEWQDGRRCFRPETLVPPLLMAS